MIDCMGRVIGAVVATIAGLLGGAVVLGFVVTLNAGFVYRSDCLTSEGTVRRSWSWEISGVIPYALPPKQAGCETNSAGEIALAKVGLGHTELVTAASLAGADQIRADRDAYASRLFASMTRFYGTPKGASDDVLMEAMGRMSDDLSLLRPPSEYGGLHAKMRAAYERSFDEIKLAFAARAAGDDTGARSHGATSLEATADFSDAFDEIRTKLGQ